jgi:hypothetical protein
VIATKRAGKIERRRRHAERIEDAALHGLVVRSTQFKRGKGDVASNVAPGSGKSVGVLKHFAEFAGRLNRSENRQRGCRSRVLELHQPVEILARQARTGTNEMPDQNLPGGLGVTELERGKHARDRCVPRQLALVHQPREKQGRQRLGVRSDHEQRVRIDLVGLAELTHTETTRKRDLAGLNQPDGHAGQSELIARAFNECTKFGDSSLVEGMGLLPGKRLAMVALRKQPVEDEDDLREPLLGGRLRHVADDDGPCVAVVVCGCLHIASFVRRGLVVVDATILPAVQIGARCHYLERPFGVRPIRRPRGGHRSVRARGRDVDQRNVGVPFRRLENHRRATNNDRPPRRRDERRAHRRRLRRVCRETLCLCAADGPRRWRDQ